MTSDIDSYEAWRHKIYKRYGFTEEDWHKAIRLTMSKSERKFYVDGIGYKKDVLNRKEKCAKKLERDLRSGKQEHFDKAGEEELEDERRWIADVYDTYDYDKFVSLWSEAQGKYGEDFYQVKDKAMCMACDIAVAFWNGSSYGVKCNIIRCLDLNKTCLVYVSEIKDNDLSALNDVLQHVKSVEDQKCFNRLWDVTFCGLPHSIPYSPLTGAPHKFSI